jgi:hypothetical protein
MAPGHSCSGAFALRKAFFSEEKKQKTFVYWRARQLVKTPP